MEQDAAEKEEQENEYAAENRRSVVEGVTMVLQARGKYSIKFGRHDDGFG